MKRLLVLINFLLTLCFFSFAQHCDAPVNVQVVANSHQSMHISWEMANTQPTRMLLFTQNNIVNHPGAGPQYADISALYGGQTTLGASSAHPSNRVADDFILTQPSYITEMDFWAYVEGASINETPINQIHVSIYDAQPTSTSTPIWTNTVTQPMSCTWSGAYRTRDFSVTPSYVNDTDRPIFQITAEINTLLPAGTYWVAVSFNTLSTLNDLVFCCPLVDNNSANTGNALVYNNGQWTAWRDGASTEQMGLPMVLHGYNTNDNLMGFNIFRNGIQLNTNLIETSFYDDNDTLIQPETEYCYTLNAVYNGCNSALSSSVCGMSGVHPCHIQTLPYQETFNDYGTGSNAYPTCWKYYHPYEIVGPYITTISASSSPVLYLAQNYYAIAPAIDTLQLVINQTVVGFKAYKNTNNSNASIQVGVMQDPSDFSSFNVVKTVTPSTTNTFEEFFVDLENVTNGGRYVAIKVLDGDVYIDDFSIYSSTCMHPLDIRVAEPGAEFVKIEWDAVTGSEPFVLDFKPSNSTTWETDPLVFDNYYYIFGLDLGENYTYQVRVRSACAPDTFYLEKTLTFTTACNPQIIPYYYDFDQDSLTSGKTTALCWLSDNTTNNASPKIYNDSFCPDNSQYLVFSSTKTGYNDAYAVLPDMSLPLEELTLRFDAKKASNLSNLCMLVVGYITDELNISTSFMPVDTFILTGTTQTYIVPFNNVSDNGRITFKGPKPLVENYNRVGVDNIIVYESNNCTPPYAPKLTQTTTNSIAIEWEPVNNATPISYTLEYRLSGDISWTSIPNITGTTYQVNNLIAENAYDFRVKAICSANSESDFSITKTYSTLCANGITVPFSENFDDPDYTSYGCWLKSFDFFNPAYISSAYSRHSEPNSLFMERGRQWIATPAIQDSIQNLTLRFYAQENRTSSATSIDGTLLVGISDNPYNPNDFDPVDTLIFDTPNTWTQYEFVLSNVHNVGTNKHIVLKYANDYNSSVRILLDDFSIFETPTCTRPTNVTATNITNSSAIIHWNTASNATTCNLRYKTDFEDVWTYVNNIQGTQYQLTLLTTNTTYLVAIQNVCGSDDASEWCENYTFKTTCGDIVSLPFLENFDTYSTGSASNQTLPSCWTSRQNISNTAFYPYVSSNYSCSGTKSMIFNVRFNQYCYLATPRLGDSINVANTIVTFKVYSQLNGRILQIGLMSDATDVSTFEPVDTVIGSQLEWIDVMVPLSSYSGTGRHVAILAGELSTQTFCYVDNFKLDIIHSCAQPTNLVAHMTTHNSTNLTWVPSGTDTLWRVAYCLDGSSDWNYQLANSNNFTLTGLNSGSTYFIKVCALCDSVNESAYTDVITINTQCSPISMLPYMEDFSAGVFPDCWRTFLASNNMFSIANHYISLNPNQNNFISAILPAIDNNIDFQHTKLSFKCKGVSYSYLTIGILDNIYDANTFVPMEMISFDGLNSEWIDYDIYLSNYTGTGRYIAFKHSGYVHIDDVKVIYSNCTAPSHFTINSLTSDQASISWERDSTITNWEYIYVPHGLTFDESDAIPSGDTVVTISGLSASEQYDLYVRSICNNASYSDWSTPFVFETACAAVNVPYQENFDEYTSAVTVPTCWTKTGTGSCEVWRNHVSYYLSAPNALYLYNTLGQYTLLSSPEINADLSQLQLKFSARFSSLSSTLEVGIMTNPLDTSTFTHIETVHSVSTVWNTFTVPLSGYMGTGKHIAFRIDNVLNTVILDNISIEELPTCTQPVNVQVSNIHTTDATVDWISGNNATQWEVAYGEQGFNLDQPSTYTLTSTAHHPITINGLTDATHYAVYVRTICDGNTHSDWSAVSTFRSACQTIDTLPYIEGFETYGHGYSSYPTCWEKVSNAYFSGTNLTFPSITNMHFAQDSSSLYFSTSQNTYSYASLPTLGNSISIDTVQLIFKFLCSMPGSIDVGVMTNPTDTSTFTLVQTVSQTTTNAWTEYTVPFNTYVGTGRNIAFRSRGYANNSMYIDEVTLVRIPTCIEPEDFHIESTTDNSITLAWTDTINTSMEWQIAYGNLGIDPTDGAIYETAYNNPFTITGLTDATYYEFYIRAVCDADDQSEWVGPIMGQTNCVSPKSLPFVENFDSYPYSSISAHHMLPECWHAYRNNNNSYIPHLVYAGYNLTYWNSVMMETRAMGDQSFVILPEMDAPLNTLQISFWKRMSDTTVVLEIGYVTDNLSANSFVPVKTITSTNAPNGALDTVLFGDYSNVPQNGYIAFKYYSPETERSQCGIDNVVVTENTPIVCLTPTNVTISNITYTSARLQWTPMGDEQQWSFGLQTEDDDHYVGFYATSHIVDLSSLRPHTHYFAIVSAVCGPLLESLPSDPIDFWTLGDDGVDDYTLQSITVYPNPTNDVLFLQSPEISMNNVFIYDVYGKLLETVQVNGNNTTIDLSSRASGLYFLRIETEKGMISKRVIKK